MEKAIVPALILVCLMALGVVCIRPVNAQYQGDITINSDGSVTPSTAPIQQTGNVYTLTSNIDGSITVNRNNTVLDGNGSTLLGGLSLNEVSNVTVKNFVIPYSMQYNSENIGISLNDTSNILVANNTITGFESVEAWNGGSYIGIYVFDGASNIIAGNNLMYNLFGIFFADTSYNQVIGNNIVGDGSSSGLFSTGIYFADASNNTIYHNNFTNSSIQAGVSDSVNVWDDGYPNGGNFWGDYWTKYPNAAEMGNSGIVNMPYVIDAQNKDRYPLMEPFNSVLYAQETIPPKISVQSPINKKYNESSVPLLFTVDKAVNWVGYSLDGKQNVTITGNTTIANMTNGFHSITVYANDTFGDIGASQTISFTVAKPETETFPTATVAAVSGASVAVIVGAGLLVYFKKRKR